jgi:AcrR family transcriptional regulator
MSNVTCQYPDTCCLGKVSAGVHVPRQYKMKRRAVRLEETRRRIVEAAIELHASGDSSMSAIAVRAGVGRMTVYRHFPDERALAIACTSAYFSERPLPDAHAYVSIADPEHRLRRALSDLYLYYADNEPMLLSAETSVVAHPDLVEALEPQVAKLAELRDVLCTGWQEPDTPARLLAAAVGLAVAFPTWRSLARDQGLSTSEAVDLMLGLVRAAVPKVTPRSPQVWPTTRGRDIETPPKIS